MNLLRSAFSELRSLWRPIAFAWLVSAFFITAVLVVSEWEDVSTTSLTRDPTAALDGSAYVGFLSQIGLLFWAASAAVCLLGAMVLLERATHRNTVQFLLVSGLFALYLGLDDAFRLHEDLLPKLGIPQKLVQISYAGFMVFYLVKWSSLILKTEYMLLVLSLGFFGASVAIDMYPPTTSLLIEDASKFVGLVFWLVYFFRAVAGELRSGTETPLAATQPSSPHANA